jgi:hypothetical protein
MVSRSGFVLMTFGGTCIAHVEGREPQCLPEAMPAQVHDLPRGSRAVPSRSASAEPNGEKQRLYREIEGLARSNVAAGAVVVELGFNARPAGFTHLSLQACARPLSDGVRVSLLTLCIRVTEPDTARISALVSDAITRFGGTRFTGLEAARFGAARRARASDGLDASVVFPSEFPFVSQNVVFVPRLRSIEETRGYSSVLAALGVEHVHDGGMIQVAHNQWRMPMRLHTQLRAFETAMQAGFRTALYSAPLPVVQSTRLELRSPRTRELECIVTRGLAKSSGCEADDLEQIENFVAERFGVELAGLGYRAKVTRAFSPHDTRWALRRRGLGVRGQGA